MTFTIEAMRGVWRAQIDSRTYFADTLEDLLYDIAPDAPDEYRWHAAEVLGGILGAEVVEVPQIEAVDFGEFFSALVAEGTEEIASELATDVEQLRGDVDESWQPTEAQQAYFEPPHTAPEIEDAR